MKVNNTIKIIIFGLIITICLCILYSCKITNIEGLNNIDCSKCEVKPTSGKCIQIKDLSYNKNFNFQFQDIRNFVFDVIDTSYVFCPWEPNCTNINNIQSQQNRLQNQSTDIANSIKNNIQCCPSDGFYSANTKNINMLPQFRNINNICNIINSQKGELNLLLNTNSKNFYTLRTLCNQQDLSGLYFNKEIKFNDNILKNPDLTIQEIIDYQNIMQVKLINTGGATKRNQDIKLLNDELRTLNLNNENDRIRKLQIQNNLADNYFISTISDETYQYKLINIDTTPIDTTPIGDSYVLQENEFFNCFGNKNTIKTVADISFTQTDLQNLQNNNYFDVDSNAPYTTMQDNIQRPYPSRQDFEMELKNLPQVNSNDNVPASVINTYLNSINSFYEKQLANINNDRNQSIQFDNHSSLTIPSTFFVYDNSINNNFDCEPSVTGHDKFKYCGPTSYYTEFNP